MTSSWAKRFLSTPNLLAGVVLILGLWASVTIGLNLHRATQADASAEFERLAQRVSSEITKRFGDQELALGGLRSLYATRSDVKRSEFRSYVASLDRVSGLSDLRGFGFARHLHPEELDAFVAAQRADGAPQFALRQIKPNLVNDRYVVQFIEPAQRNQGTMGLDLGSEVLRRAAAQRAMDSGEPTLTGSITLVQDQRNTPGVLLYMPVYANGSDAKTIEQRRSALIGLLYAPIVISELLDGIDEVESGLVHFQLFDNAVTVADGVPIDDGHDPLAQQRTAPAAYSVRRALPLPGRELTLRVNSSPAFEARVDRFLAWRISSLGVIISFLLALLLRQQMSGRRRAEDRATEMTAELALLADVIKHTHNAVSIADNESRISWVNEGFSRITGYSAEEAVGKTAGELLGSGKADIATLATLHEAAASGQGCRVEILNRAKDGREYWTATEIQPRRDATGSLVGFMEIGIDITAQRQSQARLEAALRENESLLSTLNLHAIVSVSDPDGHITSVNDAFSAISGYSRDELVGQNHRIVKSGVQSPEFWVDMWETISCGMPWRGQVCNRAKDGSLYWVDTFIAPFIGEDGKIEKYVSIRTDITASKRAADALAWSQSLLQMMSSSSPLGFLVVDNRNGEILYFNQRFCEIWGITHLAERMGRGELKYNDIIPDCLAVLADGPAFTASCAPLQDENNAVTLEDEIAFTEQRTVRRYTTQIRDAAGQYRGRFYIFEDISVRRRLRAESLRSAQLLRGAIDAIDEAFVLFDPQDRLVLCNDKYRQIYAASADLIVEGASFEEIVRKGAERGQYANAIGRVDAWVAERMAAHQTSNTSLVQHLEDGRVLRVVERRMADGHIVGFRIDITELVRATEAAELASRSKSQFLANMSHEIRTPMNAILGMLRLLHSTDLNARQLDYASKTEGAAKSLLGLLNDILDFSKMEAGKMQLDPQPFRLDQLLRELSVIVSANVGEKPLEVLFDIDTAIPKFLLGDAMRLQQVLINLSGNAIKFTARGEVVVQIKVVAQEGSNTTLRFAVRDSGIGIAPENQRRIFDGFSQAEASTTRRFGGTGLGLSIAKRLVALMGGELALDSVLGQGSCFYFTLTLPSVEAPALATETLSERVGAPLSVLVVDDNALARELLVAMSESWGWQVDAAADGTQALALMQARAASGKAP
jgi:PAS domain S-box-containing protein